MPRIVIAGAGVAGLEALAALRSHLGTAAEIELLDGTTELVERQWSVLVPFGGPAPRRFDLFRIARDHGARLRPDQLGAVEPDRGRLRTVRGDVLGYDALLVAVGARHDVAIPGALTFSGPRDAGAFSRLLDELRAGRVRRVVFAVPSGVAWSLPLYELALMTADELRRSGVEGAELAFVTPEREPLEAFGAAVAEQVRGLLDARGIEVETGTAAVRIGARGLELGNGDARAADAVVALPRLRGPWVGGLPHDDDGFLVVDEHGAVTGAPAVWAAGDGTSFPIKQGGLAAQQADAAAAAIAARFGAAVDPAPFRPALRALLTEGGGTRYLAQPGVEAGAATASGPWPPSKVLSKHLARHLATTLPEEAAGAKDAPAVDVGELLLTLAARHAQAGDRALALRCLDAADQLLGGLPEPSAQRRGRLRRELVEARSALARARRDVAPT